MTIWKDNKFQPSPSRTYVAVCYKTDYDGHYFRKFFLPFRSNPQGYDEPEGSGKWVDGSFSPIYDNTCADASWYFQNVLCTSANIECCMPWEQYIDIHDQDELNRRHRADMKHLFPKEAETAKTLPSLKEDNVHAQASCQN
jgi:hypothetical protein